VNKNRSLGNTIHNTVLDIYGPIFGGISVKEMSWRDSNEPNKAMLAVLSDPHDYYLPALALFPNRVAVANIRGDPLVSYTTAAITSTNPYAEFRPNDAEVAQRVLQEPRHVVSVLPHPKSSSDHLTKYDAFGLSPNAHQEETSLRVAKVSVLRSQLLLVKQFVLGVVGIIIGTVILLPICAIRNWRRAREDKRVFGGWGLIRRNAASLSRRYDLRAPLSRVQPSHTALHHIEEYAPFSRVAVLLDGFNTHDTIVARDDGMKIHQGKKVIKFAIDECMRPHP
jgi:hypothetical protein